jgi:hypothetical protein
MTEFDALLKQLVHRLQTRFPHYKIERHKLIREQIFVTAGGKPSEIEITHFHDIQAIVSTFCTAHNLQFNKNEGSIFWWQWREYEDSTEYTIGVSFKLYIREKE